MLAITITNYDTKFYNGVRFRANICVDSIADSGMAHGSGEERK